MNNLINWIPLPYNWEDRTLTSCYKNRVEIMRQIILLSCHKYMTNARNEKELLVITEPVHID